MTSGQYDVIVVGAGMVGACAALALARKGMRIALLEKTEFDSSVGNSEAEYDLRVSAISPRSRQILDGLGVWDRLNTRRVCYYEKMHIWHQHGDASVDFDSVELARDSLGAIVENMQIQNALLVACHEQGGIDWFMPDQVDALLKNSKQGVTLRLHSGALLEAALLIAADGRNSPMRELAGIESDSGQYRQTAFVANVTTRESHQRTAWQRFLSTGPLAFLPLANGQSSIVWSCDEELAEQLGKADDSQFCTALAEAFESSLGPVDATSKRLSFPLAWHSCERWLEGRVLLIGDAAHSVHPLAGQGVNLGFSDVELLAGLIGETGAPFPQKQLRRYERQRKSETWVATRSFSALKWIYGVDSRTVAAVRDCGMRLVDKCPAIRYELMQRAVENIT